mmetsp:Transcript_62778/g.194856  ORF Transcript_62778/g.194856 Transcript_62778/m.194856 type:complete len:431 (+) Transcript_62778:18-1310(+)
MHRRGYEKQIEILAWKTMAGLRPLRAPPLPTRGPPSGQAHRPGAPLHEPVLEVLVTLGPDAGVEAPGQLLVGRKRQEVPHAPAGLPLVGREPGDHLAREEERGDDVRQGAPRHEGGLQQVLAALRRRRVPHPDLPLLDPAVEPLAVRLGVPIHDRARQDEPRVVEDDRGVAAQPSAQPAPVADVGVLAVVVGVEGVLLQALHLPEDPLLVGRAVAEPVLAQVAPGRQDAQVAAVPSADGSHDEDGTALGQEGQQQLREEVVAQVVHREHAVVAALGLEDPVRLLQERLVAVVRREAVHAAGVEDQDVQPRHDAGHLLGEGPDCIEVPEVAGQPRGPAPAARVGVERHLGGRAQGPLRVGAVHQDVGSQAVELDGRVEAYARRAAGHEDVLAKQGAWHLEAPARLQLGLLPHAQDEGYQQDDQADQATCGQ